MPEVLGVLREVQERLAVLRAVFYKEGWPSTAGEIQAAQAILRHVEDTQDPEELGRQLREHLRRSDLRVAGKVTEAWIRGAD